MFTEWLFIQERKGGINESMPNSQHDSNSKEPPPLENYSVFMLTYREMMPELSNGW